MGDDQDDAFRVQGDGFYHKGDILGLKAEFAVGLPHHIPEQGLGFFGTVSQFTDFQFAACQIFSGQSAANLVLIYFFYLHATTLSVLPC